MDQEAIDQTIQFVRDQFIKYPHHSFGDGSVMYIHSKNVMRIALELSGDDLDNTVVAIAALLHDIGKTYIASDDELHAHHEDYNVSMSRDHLDSLDIAEEQRRQIVELIAEKSGSTYSAIIREADIVAFYTDEHLQDLFIGWALAGNRGESIIKKLNNINKLTIPRAIELATPGYNTMKSAWESRGAGLTP